jgi:hypothetical protein
MKGRQRIMLVSPLAMSAALLMLLINSSEHLLFLQGLEDLERRDGDVQVRNAKG